MRKQLKCVMAALVAVVAAMAFGSPASASSGEYARFNNCPDDGSERGGESHRGGPILRWWSQFRLAVGLVPVNCKELSTCHVGSNSSGKHSHRAGFHGVTGASAFRRQLLHGAVTIASRAGGRRERAYVVAVGHGCA